MRKIQILANHCHVNFVQLIEDTALGFEKLIHELQLSEIGILSCPRSAKTERVTDLLEKFLCAMMIPTTIVSGNRQAVFLRLRKMFRQSLYWQTNYRKEEMLTC